MLKIPNEIHDSSSLAFIIRQHYQPIQTPHRIYLVVCPLWELPQDLQKALIQSRIVDVL